jgi:hypothetical protein
MKWVIGTGLYVLLATVTFLFADDSTSSSSEKILFLSDKTDKPARFFMDAFIEELTAAGFDFTETAVDGKSLVDLESCRNIIVYSQVMAFNNISPVSAWVKARKTLAGKRVYLFVTANRWFFGSRLKKLADLVLARGGVVVDAVTMATHKMTEEQKQAGVRTLVAKIR